MQEISIHLYRHIFLREMHHDPPLLKRGLYMMGYFRKVHYGGKDITLQGRYMTTWLRKVIMWTSAVTIHVDNTHLGYENGIFHCGLPLQNAIIIVQSWKEHQTNPTWGVFYKITEWYFSKLSTLSKNKLSLRNNHNQEEPKGAWWPHVLWDPGWDPGREKEH